MSRPSTRIHVARRIGADPSSTALLLAGPSALDLWPGVHRVCQVGGRVLVEAQLVAVPDGSGPTWSPDVDDAHRSAAAVVARLPRRTPTSFVTSFSWTGPELPATTGEITLTYAPGGKGVPATYAELVMDVEQLDSSSLDAYALRRMAERFLANLADSAEARRAA